MANKTLTAKVKLETKSAEASLKRLNTLINNVNKAVQKTNTANNKLDGAIKKAVTQTNKLNSATNKVANTTNKVVATANKVNTANKNATNSARKLRDSYSQANSMANRLWRTMKSLSATYLGIMGARAIANASDNITSTENRLNNIEGGNSTATTTAMDKVYSAAQRSRSGYSQMLDNVGKTMTLAGDSFQNNVDNAIKFQEIMAKAYTIGGASAAEQASSMYQLVQALGAGVLQGDELRSVREGAPIAYKEIEKFCQGVLDTDKSLKDLASQGVVTSDMVVAAIMAAEEDINKSFDNTKTTFAQSLKMTGNMALQAFRPVLQKLNDALNSDAGKAFVQGLGTVFVALANTILWVFDLLGSFFSWCADNWNWLQWVVFGVVSALIVYFSVMAAQAVIAGVKAFISFLLGLSPLYTWIIVIGLIIAGISALAQSAVTGCDFIFQSLLVVAAGLLLVALLTQSWWLLWVVLAVAVVAIVIKFLEQIVGAVYWLGAVCYNIGMAIANFFIACWNWVLAAGHNAIAGIVNVAMGLWNVICAIAGNIGIAFQNAWIWAQNSFWGFISDVLKGVQKLEPVINAIAKAFGKEGFTVSGLISSIDSKQQTYKEYNSISDAWDTGMSTMEYQSLGDAWEDGMKTFGYKDLGESYSNGAEKGAEWSDALGNIGNDLSNAISNYGVGDLLGDIGDGLGLDVSKLIGTDGFGKGTESYLPNINDPAYRLDGAYDPSGVNDDINKALKELGNIGDDTGSIKDSMDLSNDDLDYLRKIAEMEWRNEFTTAEIRVDMTNNNTVTSDRDLDGIVEYLSDVLRDEMATVAEGVHY